MMYLIGGNVLWKQSVRGISQISKKNLCVEMEEI
jgi:hypothetical protein